MTPRPHDDGGVIARRRQSLSGLPQFIRYVSTYPDAAEVLRSLHTGVLGQRTMTGAFLWSLVDGVQLVRIASVGWPREIIERYSVVPMEVDVPAVKAVQLGAIQVDDVSGFGRTYLAALDDDLLTPRFEAMGASSAINTPLSHAGVIVGVLGFVTTEPWPDDEESRALLTGLSALLGLWLTHPRSATSETLPALGQREWSLAFTPRQRQVLRMAGEGMSNSDIARALLVSTSSVKQDLQQAMRALRSHDRASAYQRAITLGLLD